MQNSSWNGLDPVAWHPRRGYHCSMTPRPVSPPVRRAEPPEWVEDRRYFLLVTVVWCMGYAYTALPPLLSFRQTWMPLLLVALWIILRRFVFASALLPQLNRGMLLMLLWAALSALWAPDPVFVLTQVLSIVGITLIGVAYSLASWRPLRFEQGLAWATALLLLGSLFAALFFPSVGVQDYSRFGPAGPWRGITYQKNGLGQIAAIGLILWAYLWATGRTRAPVTALAVGLTVLLLVKSRSSTSLLLATITCAVLLLWLRPPLRLRGDPVATVAALFVIALPLIGLVALTQSTGVETFAQGLAGLFGKDSTFTGRVQIWSALIEQIQLHPWLGVGFNSFWGLELEHRETALEISRKLGWPVPNGHNGYLDLVNELGVVGLLLLLVFLVIHWRALAQLSRFKPELAVLHHCLLLYVLMANVTEAGWFHPITTTHVLAMYSSIEVSRQLFEHRLRAWRQRAADSGRVPAKSDSSPAAPPALVAAERRSA